jgi:hypothetical protein
MHLPRSGLAAQVICEQGESENRPCQSVPPSSATFNRSLFSRASVLTHSIAPRLHHDRVFFEGSIPPWVGRSILVPSRISTVGVHMPDCQKNARIDVSCNRGERPPETTPLGVFFCTGGHRRHRRRQPVRRWAHWLRRICGKEQLSHVSFLHDTFGGCWVHHHAHVN